VLAGPILITGADGFVGRHLSALLGSDAVALAGDVTEPRVVLRQVRATRPAAVVHLAARSSVAESWARPTEIWRVNVLGTVNVLAAVAAAQRDARVLVVSTGEVYGSGTTEPIQEDSPCRPVSPYAASKAAAELASSQARRSENLDVVVARAFPQIGPGQDERFAVGSWTGQIARLELKGGGTLTVGDTSVRRDLTDVRDVCEAYKQLLVPSVPAGVYNVASGVAVEMRDVLNSLVASARCAVEVQTEQELIRESDIPVLCGDAERLRSATGWAPKIPLEQTLREALEGARARVANLGVTKV
jgi:GDP-4-dehydro-6-deoxy-D-mannose reductase